MSHRRDDALELEESQFTTITPTTPPSRDQDGMGDGFSLPPTDRGRKAWLVLLASFVIEAVVWGLPFSFGVFQEYYGNLDVFAQGRSSVTLIGTVALAGLYLGSPVTLLSLRRWPQRRHAVIWAGLLVSSLGLIAASFATRVWQLVVTQGFVYGAGATMMYYPAMVCLDEWFVRRKGLAFGIAWAGTGFSGVIVPLLVSWSLSRFSFRTTLRACAVVIVLFVGPVLPFLKPRVPVGSITETTTRHRSRWPNFRFVLSRPFLPLAVGNVLEGLGYFLPGIYLPSYARSLGLGKPVATATVVLLNAGSFFGCLSIGFLVDRWHVTHVILLCTAGATLSVAFLWGFSGSAVVLCLFAAVYGFFAGSFSSTWPGVVRESVRQDHRAEPAIVYALLVAGRGVGSVASGPLSDALVKASPLSHDFAFGYGSKYGWLILFAVVGNLLGGTGSAAHGLGWT